MPKLFFVVGNPGAPTPNTNTYYCKELKDAVVNFALIDNVPMNGLLPDPDYTCCPLEGTFKLERNNSFLLGMKGIIDYSNCKTC